MSKYIVGVLTLLFSKFTFAELPQTVHGPDEKLQVTVGAESGKPYYTVSYNGKTFLERSALGLETSLGDFTQNLTYQSHSENEISQTYHLNKAKVSTVDYHANELTVSFTNAAKDELKVLFQVSNNDVAFRYQLSSASGATRVIVNQEATSFNLPDKATTFITPQALPLTGWMQTKPSYEEPYTFNEPIGTPSLYGAGYTFPALFKNEEKGWVLISETGVDSHYVGARLGEGDKQGVYPLRFPQPGENAGIGPTSAAMAMPASTPWRTITVGETLEPIVETTVTFDVVKPRYKASKEYKMGRATWSWIVWQDDSINYDDQVKFIDLAAELDFEYVLIDNWWDKNIGRDRMEKLVAYANSKNVDVILWYNSNGWWNDAPQTPQDLMNDTPARKKEMAWLQKIGVKGLKVDFFAGDKQETLKLYEDILVDANDFGLAITFHGSTLPRGWERMYPNFVTSEAVLASENLVFDQKALDSHAYSATILPFTRNTVAAMDFAPVFLNERLSQDQKTGTIRSTTDAFELATGILYLSPVQHFGLTPNNINEQPDYVLELLRKMPTVWDETQFIEGQPGKHVILARRKGNAWYVAAVNGEKQEKSLNVKLPMLANKEATLIYDGKDGTAKSRTLTVNNKGEVPLKLLSEGGAVIYTQ
ncbi:glycoside hydrolase family 97 protein [Alteromonas pelagimontana]|uniref:Glycoside hydrolase family 97 protein n=1 Tax=Alteromonas pelagimontana TaxID=1858656 RepID=A0A6M4MEZ7_9ALTE|nr:glycoside hydrolase family 97 protein [Alteromonas pelagimontana]QJR81653.1 glycoside hydrolase family 97 protein [Alteromonas pelagimontana]